MLMFTYKNIYIPLDLRRQGLPEKISRLLFPLGSQNEVIVVHSKC